MTPLVATKRRRNMKKESMHTSSREASEESNAETDTGVLDDDNAPFTQCSPRDMNDAEAFTKPSSTSVARKAVRNPAFNSAAALRSNAQDLYDDADSGASTYDGDVSSATNSIRRLPDGNAGHPVSHYNAIPRTRPILTSGLSTTSTASPPEPSSPIVDAIDKRGQSKSPSRQQPVSKPSFHHPAPHKMISKIKPEELQQYIQDLIEGQSSVDGIARTYKINPPPVGRPVRIYADGVYDLFHYAHALQLRQAKLFFPQVYLLVGVCSDELVLKHKAHPVLNSEERYESVRNCKWVDEVVEDAPWEVTQDFIDKWQIDYVAHDEEPYVSAGSNDIYSFAKSIGKFLPTRRTSGISTSELLSRIVEGYRGGDYDNKLEKIGRSDILSRAPSEAGSMRSHTSQSQTAASQLALSSADPYSPSKLTPSARRLSVPEEVTI